MAGISPPSRWAIHLAGSVALPGCRPEDGNKRSVPPAAPLPRILGTAHRQRLRELELDGGSLVCALCPATERLHVHTIAVRDVDSSDPKTSSCYGAAGPTSFFESLQRPLVRRCFLCNVFFDSRDSVLLLRPTHDARLTKLVDLTARRRHSLLKSGQPLVVTAR